MTARRLIAGRRPAPVIRTTADVTALCDAAARAWRLAPRRARLVRFEFRGARFVSSLTSFRMLVRTAAGKPLACRWGGP